jgi:hypothetical protein
VKSPARNFVLFKTDLFLFRQRDEDIDRWIVGGDCAGWFYARLLPVNRIRPFCEPVMEDWGWTFAVSINGVRVWVNVWPFYEIENCWLFGVEAKKRLLRRQAAESLMRAKDIACEALEDVMTVDSKILKHEWFTESPFELNIKEF